MEISSEQRRVATLDTLMAYQPIWSGLKIRRERSLVPSKHGPVCGDSKVEISYQATNQHMNRLLDNYFGLLNETVEVREVVEVPPQGYQLVDGHGNQ